MKKVAKIIKIEDQDKIRRIETLNMTGFERVMNLAKRMGAWDKPIVKKVEIRKLEFIK